MISTWILSLDLDRDDIRALAQFLDCRPNLLEVLQRANNFAESGVVQLHPADFYVPAEIRNGFDKHVGDQYKSKRPHRISCDYQCLHRLISIFIAYADWS
jgi:hypothetical protein